MRGILAIFDLQVILMLPTKRKAVKNRFSRWPPFGISVGTILATFDLQVAPILFTKIRVNSPFGSGEGVKNRFSRWPPSDQNNFSYF